MVQALQTEKKKPTIAIIGAGFAGLRAARRFEEAGVSYTIFEGSNRIGGRVFPIPYQNGYLQFGAEYVNGKDNEIYDIVKKYQLISNEELKDDDVETYVDGKEVRGSLLNLWYSFEASTTRRMEKDSARANGTVSESIDTYFNQFISGISANDVKTMESLKRIYENYYQMEWSAKAEDLCLKNLGVWDSGKEDVEFTLNRKGFDSILEEMKRPVPMERIRINSKVVNVDYSGLDPIITLSNSESFSFDAIVITSSLGYLKAHHQPLFTPRLPNKKVTAIESSGFGSNMKLFLEFDSPWWPRGATLENVASNSENGLGNEIIVFHASLWAENILIAWLAGDGPLLASKLTDWQLKDVLDLYISNNLKNHYEVAKIRNIYCPSRNDVQTRSTDESAGASRPVICFAGEHTDLTMYQTVVGAARSGLREANRILKYYQ